MMVLDLILKAWDFILEALNFILEALDLILEALGDIPGMDWILSWLRDSGMGWIAFPLEQERVLLDPGGHRPIKVEGDLAHLGSTIILTSD